MGGAIKGAELQEKRIASSNEMHPSGATTRFESHTLGPAMLLETQLGEAPIRSEMQQRGETTHWEMYNT